ncbi:cysteine peptidase family C39 domain-containing protein [Actinosynnema sp. NPDC050436]|uniref:cysteine peptidase family C39 domain-containing protein n=1 Tax=Actinosynnema sp. NPDC050436 TaxID=3155659 RepID=UPI0033CD2E03
MTAVAERTARPTRRRVRTPTLVQMEATECGAASLGIVLSHYGRHVPLEELRRDCGVGRDGSTASGLVKAARRHGMTAKGKQCGIAGLGELRLPAVLYWRFEHFLVLEGMDRRRVRLNDPALGPRAVPWDEFERSYTGIAIDLEPGPAFRREGRRFSLLAAVLRRWRHLGSVVPLTVLLGVLVAVVGIAFPVLSRVFVDRVLLGGDTGVTAGLVSALAIAAVLTFVAALVQRLLLVRAETAVALSGAARFFRHVLRLPQAFFDQRQAADLAHRVETNDAVAEVFTRRLAATAVDLALVLAYGVLLCWYDPVLGLCATAFSGLNVVVLRWLSGLRTAAVAGVQAERGRWYAGVVSTIAMIETTKANGHEDLAFRQFAARQAAVSGGRQRAGVPAAVLGVVPALVMAVTTAVLLTVGSGLVLEGTLTVGLLVAVQGLVTAMNRPIDDVSEAAARVAEVGVDVRRLLDVERYPVSPAPPDPVTGVPVEGRVVVESVTFGYNPSAAPLLTDFSLELLPGARVALVGGSGSGKSTVGRLVAGLHRPWRGRVTIDGYDLGDLDPDLRAATTAVVDQDGALFQGTVRDNVTLWDPTIGDDEVLAALADAQVLHEVARRPGGLDAPVRQGGRNFSGGQRQRLVIARALARRPRLLVLDEATSALDTATEALLDAEIRRRGATCLVVAHRLATVRDCDLIVVLAHGREVERGTHDELLARDGAYADLIRHHDAPEVTP